MSFTLIIYASTQITIRYYNTIIEQCYHYDVIRQILAAAAAAAAAAANTRVCVTTWQSAITTKYHTMIELQMWEGKLNYKQ